MRSKLLFAIKYENQVYTIIWSEQLNKEERELKYTGEAARTCRATLDFPPVAPTQ
jgi:hypothetical protein